MKKVFLFFVIAAVAVACDPVEFERDSSMVTETISGTYGPATKATIADADASFKWSVGDNIAVHVSDNEGNHKYVFTSGDGGASRAESSASFKVTYDSGYSRDAFAVFPSTIVSECTTAEDNYGQSDAQGDHTLDVTLPSTYTLDQVSGENGVTSPCPMIATNKAGFGWEFYQLCSLLRLTVGNIPATAKRLVIDFDGKNVAGNFSIPNPKGDGTSTIALTNASGNNSSIITITKDGSDAVLGETSLILNIPLPVGAYSKITVYAYNAISGGNVVSGGNSSFSYTAANTKAVKKTASLSDQSSFTFTFRDKDTQINLGGLRFVRVFSCQNKLHKGSTADVGPYTVSSATGEDDIANPVQATLKFDPEANDQLAFQVIAANGKVYSGLYNAPTGGFTFGAYDLTVDVKAYTFTASSGKKVYFAPGDLGLDNNGLSFTEPFITWGWGDIGATQRIWFNYDEGDYPSFGTGQSVYGINWRFPKSFSNKNSVSFPHEWRNIIQRTIDEGKVATYYHVKVGSNYCLLMPPDETVENDLEGLTNGAENINYIKYLGKGFVLLINTGRAYQYNTWSWPDGSQGFYWGWHNYMSYSRRFFTWTESNSNTPDLKGESKTFRMRVRYVHDVE